MTSWSFGTAVRTLWQEARGEPPEGQRAVAHVLVNRLASKRWGTTLGSVCVAYAWQFSGWWATDKGDDENRLASTELPDDAPILVSLGAILQAAIDGETDPTGGATHYYAKNIAPPKWTEGATFCGEFGNQFFYKDVK